MVSLNSFQSSDSSAMALLAFFFMGFVVQASCLEFSYTNFPDSEEGNFILTPQNSYLSQGALQVTPDSGNPNTDLTNKFGRALYKETFNLWKKNESIASFNTSFLLNIQNMTNPGGEGLAFILTNNREVPSNSFGPWLGIVNESTNGSSLNRIVAIEFDTRKSTGDIDGYHVALDVNGLNGSIDNQFSLASYGIDLFNEFDVFVRIHYDGELKQMIVNVAMGNDTTVTNFVASRTFPIDLSEFLLADVYVGFSASTSEFTELNCVKSWNFTSVDIGTGNENRLLLILLVILLVIVLGIGCTIFFLLWKKKRILKRRGSRMIRDLETMLADTAKGPVKFRLKELVSGTSNFHPDNKLGQGGCGTVYKGFLKEINSEVAVKRVSKDAERGEEDFIAEVMTISRLHHKNLVRLIGWCCEGDELLLVYQFMPGGSLDKLIFSNKTATEEAAVLLSWGNRHKIIHGVASALYYLHYGCEGRVLHRDVKASNVMLDSDYNARLGDFGLARTVQQGDKTHHSTVEIAGTPGYIAPEYTFTGRVGVETDVYGFGVFALEVVCGRKPGKHNNMDYIVDWVWALYGKERVLDAADPRLYGEFDGEQMECVLRLGLACCNPNPNERPSMRVALQVLNGEAAPPVLPSEKPAFMWPAIPNSELVDIDALENYTNGSCITPSQELTGR